MSVYTLAPLFIADDQLGFVGHTQAAWVSKCDQLTLVGRVSSFVNFHRVRPRMTIRSRFANVPRQVPMLGALHDYVFEEIPFCYLTPHFYIPPLCSNSLSRCKCHDLGNDHVSSRFDPPWCIKILRTASRHVAPQGTIWVMRMVGMV